MNRLFYFCVAVLTVIFAAHGIVQAQQPVEFLPTGVGNWATPTNWQNYGAGQNVPEGFYNETAVISSGGTAFVDAVLNDSTTPRGPGAITVSNGKLEIRNTGALTVSDPTGGGLVNRSVTIGGTLNVQGTGALNAASITFQGTGVFDVDFTTGTTSPVNVSGAATLNGALALDYTALVNPSGSRTLITAGSAGGAFSSVTATGLGANQGVRVTTTGGLVQATINNLLSMTVNRQTGAVSINNTHASGISLDGYSIRSAAGSLNPAGLTGLGGGWTTSASNSANGVVQLFEGTLGNPAATIAGGASPSISASGLFAAATPTAFLQEVEDLVFQYTNSTGTVTGAVNYVGGTKVHNNIVLTINSAGQAAMLNTSSFAQQVEAYRITSTVNPLQTGTWNSLDDQNVGGSNGWSESAQSGTGMLLELREDGTTTFNNTTVYNIGQILNPGFSQSGMGFEFLLAGGTTLTQGVVVFGNLPVVNAVLGDYNQNGVVDAADYTVWRNNLNGPATSLPNRNPANTGNVNQADYTYWKSRFGATTGSGGGALAAGGAAVPEPGTLLLGMLALCGVAAGRRNVP